MCGRFANQQQNSEAWDAYFDVPFPDNAEFLESVTIGYNIAPTQTIPVVTKEGWLAARWGMIAPWTNVISTRYATFNARCETVAEKATFRNAWSKGRRCLVPAIGYYEWKKTEDGKQPYFVRPDDDSPIFFGGLYEPSRDDLPSSCTIITLPASDEMSPLHHRIPLMFSISGSDPVPDPGSDPVPDPGSDPVPDPGSDPRPAPVHLWLETGSFDGHLDALSWHAVDKAVNNPRNQGVELINP